MRKLTLLMAVVAASFVCSATAKPKANVEKDGFVMVEAEDFVSQTGNDIRAWHKIDQNTDLLDYDVKYKEGASEGSYIQILPDTRRTHGDPFKEGENFTDEMGKMAVIKYKVKFKTPGRYYVWVSSHSSNSEDNGVHVGIDGTWPASGFRMQWCEGKNNWYWASKQRTNEVHCGVPGQIWIDVPSAGVHEIMFSMREDGFAMDRFALSQEWDVSKQAAMGKVNVPAKK